MMPTTCPECGGHEVTTTRIVGDSGQDLTVYFCEDCHWYWGDGVQALEMSESSSSSGDEE